MSIVYCLFILAFYLQDTEATQIQYVNQTTGCGYFIDISNQVAISGITKDMKAYGYTVISNRISYDLYSTFMAGCRETTMVSGKIYMNGDGKMQISEIVRRHECDYNWIDTPSAWILVSFASIIGATILGFVIFFVIQKIRRSRSLVYYENTNVHTTYFTE